MRFSKDAKSKSIARMNLPLYRPLTPGDLKQIDRTARHILKRVGIRIYDNASLDFLKKAGARVNHKNKTVYFDGNWLDEVVGHAPSQFTLYSRDGKNDIHLGQGKVYFTNGGRVFRRFDTRTGRHRYTVLRDVANTATLVDHLEHINFYIIACQAHDLKPEAYHLNDFFHAFNHTTKHVMGGCDNLEGVEQVWKLASFIAGDEDKLKERPFVSVITNPISPLIIETNTLSILRFCCTHGIPVTCAPAPIAGMTAPVTLAGTLAQMHAEALAGFAIAQAFSPGAKVLYGAVATAMDLRNMDFTMGSVEMAMMNAAAVQLAKLYNLPIYASGGVTEAKTPSMQAGIEKSLSNLMVALAGADCIHLAAGMLDSGNSISYEQYVIDNEIIGMVQRIISGIKVNEDTLGFDVIEKVGPGGHYVIEDHTIEHMMDEFFYPKLCIRSNFDTWEEQGKPDMLRRAEDEVQRVVESARADLFDSAFVTEVVGVFPGIKIIKRNSSKDSGKVTHVIACAAFKPAIEYLQLTRRYPGLRVTYLPSNLHIGPQRLRNYLRNKITAAQKRYERIVCLYGDCFPHIDDFCQQYGVIKVPGFHCYEMLLGSAQFQKIVDETAGTYFLEKDLILNFEEYCMKPLELYDEEIRKCCFDHYNRLLYVRQPSDPDLVAKASKLAEFLDLSLEIRDADYSHLEKVLTELL